MKPKYKATAKTPNPNAPLRMRRLSEASKTRVSLVLILNGSREPC